MKQIKLFYRIVLFVSEKIEFYFIYYFNYNKMNTWFKRKPIKTEIIHSEDIVSNLARRLWDKNKHIFINGRLRWTWYGYEDGKISQSILPIDCIDRLLEIQNYINNIFLRNADDIELTYVYDTFTEKIHIDFQVKPKDRLPPYTE